MSKTVADGYGEAVRPLDEVVREVVAARKDPLPTVVWFCRPDDAKRNDAFEQDVLGDDDVAIALQRFVRLQADVSQLPPGKLADDLRAHAPVFFFHDPAGKTLVRIEGDDAVSVGPFYEAVEKAWEATHVTRLRDFNRKMSSNLDKADRIDEKLAVLEVKRRRAGGSASRLRSIDRQQEKLEKERTKLLEDRKEIVEACKLKDPEPAETAAAPR